MSYKLLSRKIGGQKNLPQATALAPIRSTSSCKELHFRRKSYTVYDNLRTFLFQSIEISFGNVVPYRMTCFGLERVQLPAANFSAFLFFLCLSLHQASAQQTLKGQITDSQTRETLIGANIFLADDFSIGSQSDVEGNFQLEVPAEKGQLIVSYIGYKEQLVDFDGVSDVLEIALEPKTAEIEMVVVKGDKLTGQVFAVEKISKLDIYLNPSSKADALIAVQSNPAATTIDETANISLRGSPASETGIFLNNVPINDAVRLDQANGVGQFSIFNTSTIESVSVFASNPPLEFGNATSGVVALYTDDDMLDNSQSISLNLVGIGASMTRKIKQKTSLNLFTNWNSSFLLKTINPSSLSDLQRFNTIDFGTYGIHHFNTTWQLKFFNYAITENYQFKVRFPSFEDEFQQNKQRNLSIINLIQQKEQTRFEWNQGINFSTANYQVGNLDVQEKNFDYFAGLNYAYYPENGSIKIGLNTNIHRMNVAGRFPLFENGLSALHPSQSFKSKNWIVIPEAFVYSKWTFFEDFSMGVGGRFHPELDGLDTYTSYQINLAYTLSNQHHLIASIGSYHKYQLPEAETELLKLSSKQYSLDYQGTANKWKWSAAIYHKNNRRGALPNLVNGAEVYGAYAGRKLKAGLSLASIQSTLKSGELEYPSEHDLSYFLRATAQYTFPGDWDLGLVYWQRQGRYYLPVSASYFDAESNTFAPIYAGLQEGLRIPDYKRMDLSISKIFGLSFGSVVVYVNANNLLNFKNVSYYNYNYDYTEVFEEYLNQRVVFFGGVLNFG